jgi:NAD(P)-dependent dehydrogenase (short-subunit alcohol dehydrogenase family)
LSSRYANYPSLENRTVLITGGGSGIGASLVEHFVEQNARVAFVDIADEPSNALVAKLGARCATAPLFVQCDVTDPVALEAAIVKVADALGPITVLVNNAGNDDRHEFQSVTSEYWDQRMEVLVKHQFFAAKAVYEGMKTAGGGSIINFSSTTWLMGEGGYVCYTTAKAAIFGLTRSLARDFGPVDIRVNAVLPGWVMTERQLKLWITPGAEAEINEKQALKHKLYPADVARMVLFLAADDSAMTTGQSFVVDGGWS